MARRPTFYNLQQRFPDATEDEIEDALKQVDDHGGKATALLAKKHQPLPVSRRSSTCSSTAASEVQRAADFAAARKLLEPYRGLSSETLVEERSIAALKEALPDILEATLAVELLRHSGDVENAKSWLWRPDQGAAWRRDQATDISGWMHETDGQIAIFSAGPWTKKRLVLDRATQTYVYTEEAWAHYDDTCNNGITRTRHAGGRWIMKVQSQGFLIVVRGSMTTTTFNPENHVRLDEHDEEHEEMLWMTTAPWPILEEVRANLPPVSKADKIKRRFRQIDRNRDSHLDCSELKILLTVGGTVELSDKEVRALFNRLDMDHSGLISFDNFVDYLYPSKDSALVRNHAIYGSWYDDQDFRHVLKKTASGCLE